MRGQPDYAGTQQKAVGVTLSDMADLAVRLGSIVEYDRRGDIVILDDFEDTIIKWTIGVGALAYVRHDSTSVKSGSQALELHLGNVPGGNTNIRKDFHVLGILKVGAEISFSVPQDTYQFEVYITYYDGDDQHFGRVTVDFNARELTLWDNILGETLIAGGLDFTSSNHFYHIIKYVVDFSTLRYSRLLLNNIEYDVSAYTLTSVAAPLVLPTMRTELRILDNGAGDEASIWLDDFIFTQNEP
ncbi:hypothetical protein ES703_15109 [subsurface metagenome]